VASVKIDSNFDGPRVIDENHVLTPILQGQLKFWGFSSTTDRIIWTASADAGTLLDRLVPYLQKNRVDVELAPNAQEILNERLERRASAAMCATAGLRFKQGEFEENQFKTFREFLSRNIQRQLKPHQVKAAYHAYIVGKAANFSVPGSGKTSVVLSVFEKLRNEGKIDFLFVVGPASSFGPWKFEFQHTLGRSPNPVILAGMDKGLRLQEYSSRLAEDADLYLTTFHTLMNDQKEVEKFLFTHGTRALLVVDEAHYMKKLSGEWSSALLRISKNCNHRMILTGTPMPHSFSDLFNLFDFLWDDLSPLDERTKMTIMDSETKGDDKKARDLIEQKIGGLFYRVRKIDLGLLPQDFHNPIQVALNPLEAEVYRLLSSRIHELSEQDYTHNFETLTRLRRARMTRMRQAASYVPLLRTAIADDDEQLTTYEPLAELVANYSAHEKPSKASYLLKYITELTARGEKVLVWTNFIGTLHFLLDEVRSLGVSAKAIYGAIPVEHSGEADIDTREKIREEFVNGDLQVLIAIPAACAESISLHTGCQHAFYYDLNYNCAQYLQSLDRIHRVGGSESRIANYYFLQGVGTLDSDILDSLQTRAARMEAIIDMDYSIYTLDMTEEDDEELNAYTRLFQQ
jgi:SNF2 family DNA or RNA helicase